MVAVPVLKCKYFGKVKGYEMVGGLLSFVLSTLLYRSSFLPRGYSLSQIAMLTGD
jgi:hypothetical protein